MSYAFLLKYIIIGDSGTFVHIQVSESLVFFSSTLTKDTDKNMKSPSEYNLVRNFSK